MYQEIVSLLEYLVENKPGQCPDKKHVDIALNLFAEAQEGTIQIAAVGSWIQGFSVPKFNADLWTDYNTELTVYQGDSSVRNYKRYSIRNTSIGVKFVFVPLRKHWKHYVSFVLTASKGVMLELYPRLRKKVAVFARQHDVHIILSGSGYLCRLTKRPQRCCNCNIRI